MTTYTINNSTVTQTTGFTPAGTLAGGDILIIPSSWTNHLYISGVDGSIGNPIIITNPSDAKVSITEVMTGSPYSSISISQSTHILIDGSNYSSETYGIHLQNGIYGLRLYESEYVEIKYIEIESADGAGIMWQKGSWTASTDVNSLVMHHNYIHNTESEGMYIGTSNFDPALYPSMKNCLIYSNIVKNTPWDGIQLCGADVGTNKIYDNYCDNCGLAGSAQHCHGIFIDNYTIAEIYNNTVIDTYCDGIHIVYIGTVIDLHDNVFVRSGRHGIANGSNINGQKIINNTIVDSNYRTSGGYGIWTSTGIDRGEIRYNLIVGTTTAGQTSTSYATVQNNLLSNSIPAKDYSSNAGYSPTDFDGTTRPVGTNADAGAFEFLGAEPYTRHRGILHQKLQFNQIGRRFR
jgi:hypothetical protein